MWKFSRKSEKMFFGPFCNPFLTNRDKNEMTMIKYGKFSSIFEFSISKLEYVTNENRRKKCLTHFLRHFWLIEARMKMKIKKFGKMKSIFEFSILKLGYMELFIKIWEKTFFSKFYLRTYWDWGVERVNKCLLAILPPKHGEHGPFWNEVIAFQQSEVIL